MKPLEGSGTESNLSEAPETKSPQSRGVFPYRLFRWFLLKQVLTSFVALGFTAIVFSIWLRSEIDLDENTRRVAFKVLASSLTVSFLIIVSISVFMARGLVVPLGRLIDKTKKLRKFPFEELNLDEEELAFDEPGEWYELERALNKLGQDLRKKTIRLSREKTELRAIMGAVSESILAVDRDFRPLFYNSQFAIMFQVQELGPRQNHLQELIRSPEILQGYEQCLSSGEVVRLDVELSHPLELDQTLSLKIGIAPLIKKHNQEVYGAVAIFHDITNLKVADRIRIEFVGNVSHELRTPLTSIKGYLQTVIQDIKRGKSEESLVFLEIIQGNVDRLMALVTDLLNLSSLESGVDLKRELILTRELTEAVLAQINSRAHVIRIHYGFEEFEGDYARIEQVLRNLLQNAVRYVPEGKKIEISWEPLSPQGFCLRVKDDGPGIPKKHHARLFERFYRIDESRSRDIGGTGIGLSLVKHIMARHGGTVELISSPGQGAEFICRFP